MVKGASLVVFQVPGGPGVGGKVRVERCRAGGWSWSGSGRPGRGLADPKEFKKPTDAGRALFGERERVHQDGSAGGSSEEDGGERGSVAWGSEPDARQSVGEGLRGVLGEVHRALGARVVDEIAGGADGVAGDLAKDAGPLAEAAHPERFCTAVGAKGVEGVDLFSGNAAAGAVARAVSFLAYTGAVACMVAATTALMAQVVARVPATEEVVGASGGGVEVAEAQLPSAMESRVPGLN
jgi:hypothetical protein